MGCTSPVPEGRVAFCRPGPQVGLHRPHLGLHAGLPGSTFLRRPMDNYGPRGGRASGGADGAAPLLPATLDEELQTTPVTRFLVPLGLGQHRDVFKQLGFDDPADFAAQSPADAADMKAALLESVPLGHVQRVMRRTAEMTGAAAQRLQPGPEQQSAASTTLLQSEERVEPSFMGPRYRLSGFVVSGFAWHTPVVARRSHTPARQRARQQGRSSPSHAPPITTATTTTTTTTAAKAAALTATTTTPTPFYAPIQACFCLPTPQADPQLP